MSTGRVLSAMEVDRFAREQAARRLARVAFEVRRILRSGPTEAAVHDFRVATRRFRAALDVFQDYFPRAERRYVKKQIRQVFALAGEVRNRDIATDLIHEVAPGEAARLTAERQKQERLFVDALRGWARRGFSARWRERLALP